MALTFSPDGKLLASMSRDKDVFVWDASTWKRLAALNSATSGNSGTGGMAVAFSPDGRLLVTGTADQTVRVWELPERK